MNSLSEVVVLVGEYVLMHKATCKQSSADLTIPRGLNRVTLAPFLWNLLLRVVMFLLASIGAPYCELHRFNKKTNSLLFKNAKLVGPGVITLPLLVYVLPLGFFHRF